MKTLFLIALAPVLVMLLSHLFRTSSPARPVDLDGLATLELPADFHLDDTPDQALPPARRRLRQPYLRPPLSPDLLTYYVPSRVHSSFSGPVVPVLLRVTLYADDVPLPEAPDQAYFTALARRDYYHDGQNKAVFARLAPVAGGLYFAEEPQTAHGWFSVKAYRQLHLILTDPAKRVRLFLSVDDREMARPDAEQLLRQALASLRREPAILAQHFGYVRHFLQHSDAIKAANIQANVPAFNQQLARAGLPPVQAAAPYEQGRFVDTGTYFYGVNEEQSVFLVARLGTSAAPQPVTPTYFSHNNGAGRYLASVNQQAILQQHVPAGQELRTRTGVSEPLWFPPEEFAHFQLPDLLRETAESQTRAQRQPGFAGPPPRPLTHWNLSRAESTENAPAFGTPADYRHAGLRFGAVVGPHFLLRYLGTRTMAGQPPELVFTLEIFDGSTRYRAVAADAQYHTVDATQGGQLDLTAAGARYRVRVEPLAQGHLTVEAR